MALPGGGTVGACVAVNAVGDVVAEDGSVLAGPGTVTAVLRGAAVGAPVGGSTTLAVVATDLRLDKARALRMATVAHDGLARSIRPVHTAFDGDAVFAAATGLVDRAVDDGVLLLVQTAAAEVLARAVRRAVSAVG